MATGTFRVLWQTPLKPATESDDVDARFRGADDAAAAVSRELRTNESAWTRAPAPLIDRHEFRLLSQHSRSAEVGGGRAALLLAGYMDAQTSDPDLAMRLLTCVAEKSPYASGGRAMAAPSDEPRLSQDRAAALRLRAALHSQVSDSMRGIGLTQFRADHGATGAGTRIALIDHSYTSLHPWMGHVADHVEHDDDPQGRHHGFRMASLIAARSGATEWEPADGIASSAMTSVFGVYHGIRGYRPELAMVSALMGLCAGDVMLLEFVRGGRFPEPEIDGAEPFNAYDCASRIIGMATGLGVSVIVPAGNTGKCIDAAYGKTADRGGIVVGAVYGGTTVDGEVGVRWGRSSWGRRVDAHCWGTNVPVLNPNLAPDGGPRFDSANGTSAASAIVAGALAAVSSAVREAGHRFPSDYAVIVREAVRSMPCESVAEPGGLRPLGRALDLPALYNNIIHRLQPV